MTTTSSTTIPSHHLPGPRRDRAWRAVLILIAAAMIVVAVGSVVGTAIVSAIDRSSYGQVPAVHDLGRPSALTLTSSVADVEVRTDPTETEVTLRLVDREGRSGGTVPARVTVDEQGGRTTVAVDQPSQIGPWPVEEARDLELVVPADLSPALDLDLRADVGDVTASGAFGALSVTSDVGDIRIPSLDTTGALSATASVGDVRIELVPDAAPAGIDVTADTGDVVLALPGSTVYRVTTVADIGTTSTGPGIAGTTGPLLTARADIGDVTISR